MFTQNDRELAVEYINKISDSSVQREQLGKIPILIPDKVSTNTTGIVLVDQETEAEYIDYSIEDIGKYNGVSLANSDPGLEEQVFYSDTTNAIKYNIKCVEKYHYMDRSYLHCSSSFFPETTFGILKVDNLPYRPFYDISNKNYLMERLDKLVYQKHIEPLMLFVDGEFVSWSDIIVVFDAGESYLLLFGEKYEYYRLQASEISMIILPFAAVCLERETDLQFTRYYNAFVDYIETYGAIDPVSKKLNIRVPNINTSHKYRDMNYNIGFWIYQQMLLRDNGMLINERYDKIRNIMITRTIVDGDTVVDTITARFNALDRDSYDVIEYESFVEANTMPFRSLAFSFDNDGHLTNDSSAASNVYILEDDISFNSAVLNTYPNIYYTDRLFKNATLFLDNFIVFKNNTYKYSYRENISLQNNNTLRINNPDESTYRVYVFVNTKVRKSYNFDSDFYHQYYDTITNNAYYDSITNAKHHKYLELAENFSLNNKNNGEEDLEYAVTYDPSMLLDFYKSEISTTVLSGEEANENISNGIFKVHRNKAVNNESYCIVFVNGELMSTYHQMTFDANWQYIPCKGFNSNDVVDLLYFNHCNNNTIKLSGYSGMVNFRSPYIKTEDLKLFNEYPTNALKYNNTRSSNIIYNISTRDKDNNFSIIQGGYVAGDVMYAMSSCRFVYQNIKVTQDSYRLRLNEKRFMGCDNQRQFMLFINGRRVDDRMFLITIPKYTRPFDRLYLYTSTFVTPEDKVELFYVPVEMKDINDENVADIQTNGYVNFPRDLIKVPFNNKSYVLFANGKKIPNTDFTAIGTSVFRFTKNIKTLNNLIINAVTKDNIPEVEALYKSYRYSTYESAIQYIIDNIGYSELDKLLNQYITITDSEEKMFPGHVGKVAILNEVVRDWWVSNGYNYNEALLFFYDYEVSGYETVIDSNGNIGLALPAMDATQKINIDKDPIRFIWVKLNGEKGGFVEYGNKLVNPIISWEYNDHFGRSPLAKQYVETTSLSVSLREYIMPTTISTDRTITFQAQTENGDTCTETLSIKYVNGIYYGMIDEDALQYFSEPTIENVDGMYALDPVTGKIISKLNGKISAYNSGIGSNESSVLFGYELKTYLTGEGARHETISANPEFVEYPNIYYLPDMFRTLTKVLTDNANMTITDYILEPNKYFVFAAPKNKLVNSKNELSVKFYSPSVKNIIHESVDQYVTPVYTTGDYDGSGKYPVERELEVLDSMKIEKLCEFNYTNDYGYTEPYVVYKSNGFFTRLHTNTKATFYVVVD